jgi:hypothetical protein
MKTINSLLFKQKEKQVAEKQQKKDRSEILKKYRRN